MTRRHGGSYDQAHSKPRLAGAGRRQQLRDRLDRGSNGKPSRAGGRDYGVRAVRERESRSIDRPRAGCSHYRAIYRQRELGGADEHDAVFGCQRVACEATKVLVFWRSRFLEKGGAADGPSASSARSAGADRFKHYGGEARRRARNDRGAYSSPSRRCRRLNPRRRISSL